MNCPRCEQETPQTRTSARSAEPSLRWSALAVARPTPRRTSSARSAVRRSAGEVGRSEARSPASYTPKHLAERILTSKAALEGERKQVTVLFADLKGSMELLADRDPEEARKILDPVLERMMEACIATRARSIRSWATGSWPSSAPRSPARTTPCGRAMPR